MQRRRPGYDSSVLANSCPSLSPRRPRFGFKSKMKHRANFRAATGPLRRLEGEVGRKLSDKGMRTEEGQNHVENVADKTKGLPVCVSYNLSDTRGCESQHITAHFLNAATRCLHRRVHRTSPHSPIHFLHAEGSCYEITAVTQRSRPQRLARCRQRYATFPHLTADSHWLLQTSQYYNVDVDVQAVVESSFASCLFPFCFEKVLECGVEGH
ncbi:hypothetical protein BaRGS_00028981 [Batillaria attramentaria]|uniref:Uncharacterized protein n=1 Tax=Batillaria attramentaria TaxID=370345 RepID=A0ABD0JYH5_9CAEN